MLRLNGITPVMLTPFRDDESLDEDGLRQQVEYAINSGAAALCGPGYGSEFYKLSDGERCRFARVVVDQVKKRLPVILAASSDSTFATIEWARFAERISADCIMVVPPRTVKVASSEIVDYYSRICDAVSLPVMLQDLDSAGPGLPVEVFVRLAERHSNFLFAKLEIALPGQKCAAIMERTGGQLQIIYGLSGIAMLDGLYRGASAYMPGTALTEIYVQTYRLYQAGRKDQARKLFSRLIPFLAFGLQHLELAIKMDKLVMAKRGIISSSRMRHPTLRFDRAEEEQIAEHVDEAIALAGECRATPSGS